MMVFMNQLNNITIKHCPCHSGKSYEQCCRLFHLDFYQAQTAEDLMRSRFTAFAIGSMNSENQKFFEQYLLQTWHPKTRPAEMQLDTSIEWINLKIKGRKDGKKRHHKGMVHFSAEFQDKLNPKNTGTLEEMSQFEKDSKGGWLYVEGEVIN